MSETPHEKADDALANAVGGASTAQPRAQEGVATGDEEDINYIIPQ
jgi:hypothetical protein